MADQQRYGLRPRNQISRPEKYKKDYGYQDGPDGVPEYARKRKRVRREIPHEPSPISPEPPEDNPLPSNPHSELQPYLERGREKILDVKGVCQVDETGRRLFVQGESVAVTCRSGATYVGALQSIQIQISFGVQLLLELRPYYSCLELDPYVVCNSSRELCLKSPDKLLTITDAVHIKPIRVVHSMHEEEGEGEEFLLRRAFMETSQQWLSLPECLRQERLTTHVPQEPVRINGYPVSPNYSHESSEEEEASSLPPDLCLLKHAFESDFGARGFVDFLYDGDSEDQTHFMDQLNNQYIQPMLQVGRGGEDHEGCYLFRSLYDRFYFHCILMREPAKTEKCCLCLQTTLCPFSLHTEDDMGEVTTLPISKGCAKRVNRLTALEAFLDDHGAAYTTLTKEQVIDLHTELMKLLYDIDRSLKRPIRERLS